VTVLRTYLRINHTVGAYNVQTGVATRPTVIKCTYVATLQQGLYVMLLQWLNQPPTSATCVPVVKGQNFMQALSTIQ
jgi:hypothetical protein